MLQKLKQTFVKDHSGIKLNYLTLSISPKSVFKDFENRRTTVQNRLPHFIMT